MTLDDILERTAAERARAAEVAALLAALLAELDAAVRRAQVAEDRAEMAAHDARWGTR